MKNDETRLIEENQRLVYMVINDMYRHKRIYRWELEDMKQEGMIGLLRAARQYKPESGVSFSTFAVACIRNAIASKLKVASAQRRAQDRCHPSLQMDLRGKWGDYRLMDVIPSKTSVEDDVLGMTLEDIRRMLEGYDRAEWYEALVRNMNGETLAKIGKEKGVTRQRIGIMVVEARQYIADEVKRRGR